MFAKGGTKTQATMERGSAKGTGDKKVAGSQCIKMAFDGIKAV